jgi:hypothetical protein
MTDHDYILTIKNDGEEDDVSELFVDDEVEGIELNDEIFDTDRLAVMLAMEEVFVLGGTTAETPIRIGLLCSDTFAYAMADAEVLLLGDIAQLWEARKTTYGLTRWVCLRRKQRPLSVIVERMKAAGAWDEELEALP